MSKDEGLPKCRHFPGQHSCEWCRDVASTTYGDAEPSQSVSYEDTLSDEDVEVIQILLQTWEYPKLVERLQTTVDYARSWIAEH